MGAIRSSLCRFRHRVFLRFVACDTKFFGLASGAISICWGLWLMEGGHAHFLYHPNPVYWFMRWLLPHEYLTTLFLFYGIGYWLSFIFEWPSGRRYFLLMGVYLWCWVTLSINITGDTTRTAGTYGVLTVGCAWSFIRQREIK